MWLILCHRLRTMWPMEERDHRFQRRTREKKQCKEARQQETRNRRQKTPIKIVSRSSDHAYFTQSFERIYLFTRKSWFSALWDCLPANLLFASKRPVRQMCIVIPTWDPMISAVGKRTQQTLAVRMYDFPPETIWIDEYVSRLMNIKCHYKTWIRLTPSQCAGETERLHFVASPAEER